MPLDFVVGLPAALWLLFRFILPAGPFEMDNGQGTAKGTFFPLLILYQFFFYIVAGLGLYGAYWNWQYDANLWPSLFLFAAALYALMFNGLLVFYYERYLAHRYPGQSRLAVCNYTIDKYALILSLGISSVMLFVAGAAWVAWVAGVVK
jgi:hypothetical protein